MRTMTQEAGDGGVGAGYFQIVKHHIMGVPSPTKGPVQGLLTKDQITPDTEVYLIRVPTSVPVPDLQNMDINLKSPGRIFVGEQHFSPVVMKGEHGARPKTMILHSKKGIPSSVVVEVKRFVTLREAVQVPAVPKIEIPPPYKVPAPGDSVVRHPIYGRDLQAGKRWRLRRRLRMNQKKRGLRRRKRKIKRGKRVYRNARVLHTVDNGRLPGAGGGTVRPVRHPVLHLLAGIRCLHQHHHTLWPASAAPGLGPRGGDSCPGHGAAVAHQWGQP